MEEFDVKEGLALDVVLTTPITRGKEQEIFVALVDGMEDRTMRAWDHRTGYLVGNGNTVDCAFHYPVGVPGPKWGDRYAGAASGAATPDMKAGRPYRIRLRCFRTARAAWL